MTCCEIPTQRAALTAFEKKAIRRYPTRRELAFFLLIIIEKPFHPFQEASR
jgi:hypothetical protein